MGTKRVRSLSQCLKMNTIDWMNHVPFISDILLIHVQFLN